MTEEAEVEMINSDSNDVEEPNHNHTSETGALVEVTFQKKKNQEQKFLEAEPKILGVTQIMLTIFLISITSTLWAKDYNRSEYLTNVSMSLVAVIAGSLAIAAQNLHLPTLKTCLGFQILTCVTSAFLLIISSGILILNAMRVCWGFGNNTVHENMCKMALSAYDHMEALKMLVMAAQIAFSATLAAFCCKVIACCSPRSSAPMIIVSAPSPSQ